MRMNTASQAKQKVAEATRTSTNECVPTMRMIPQQHHNLNYGSMRKWHLISYQKDGIVL